MLTVDALSLWPDDALSDFGIGENDGAPVLAFSGPLRQCQSRRQFT